MALSSISLSTISSGSTFQRSTIGAGQETTNNSSGQIGAVNDIYRTNQDRENDGRRSSPLGGEDDSVSLSPEALARGEQEEDASPEATRTTPGRAPEAVDDTETADDAETANETQEETEAPEEESESPGELSESEQELVRDLKARDLEVRAHEQAHLAAAGDLALGGPRYDYQRGPDGRRYAVGGSVEIDTSPVPNDPEATIQKATRIKRAALAPQEPSSTDRSVASRADAMKAEARQQLAAERREEAQQSAPSQNPVPVNTAPARPEPDEESGIGIQASESQSAIGALGATGNDTPSSGPATSNISNIGGLSGLNPAAETPSGIYSAQGRNVQTPGSLLSLVG